MPCSRCGSKARTGESRCRSCTDRSSGQAARTDGGRRRTGTRRRGRSASFSDRVPLGLGVGLGVAAYLVNFVVMGVFTVVESDSTDNLLTGIGWLLYGAHNVPVKISSAFGSGSRNLVQQLVATGQNTIPGVAYYAVPALVLLTIGLVLGSRAAGGRGAGSPLDGFVAGASTTVAYLVLAVLGTFLFTEGGAGGSASPDLVLSAAIMGVAYPLVLGGLGGLLGYVASN